MNYLTYLCKVMNITQSYNGQFSHKLHTIGDYKDYPIDEAGKDKGRSGFYCPCDEIKITRIYGLGKSVGNTIWLQSTDKVQTPTFNDFISILIAHPDDDEVKDLKVGQVFRRGERMFSEGSDGYTTGNNGHISAARGKTSSWVENSNGKWVLKGDTKKPEECFFIDPTFTKTKNSAGLKFIYLLGRPTLKNEKVNQIEILIPNLRCRKKPNGRILGYIREGLYNVLSFKTDTNYTWYKVGTDKWVAFNEKWARFYPKKDNTSDNSNNNNSTKKQKESKNGILNQIISFIKKIIKFFKITK